MLINKSKEWTVNCPWGKLALISWGDAGNPAVLLVHGYCDTAATFLPILETLPDNYYYVAFDYPGHGLSDPLLSGVIPYQMHLVESMRIAVDYLKWDRFMFLAHSMGILIGLYYNTIYPGRIKSFIAIDPGPPFGAQLLSNNFELSFPWSTDYYDNYNWYNSPPRNCKYDVVIRDIAKKRGLNEEQAKVILSRSFETTGDGNFRMTLDNKMKKMSHMPLSEEVLFHMVTSKQPFIFNIVAKDNLSEFSKRGVLFLKEVQNANENCHTIFLSGGHDLHIVNPVEVAKNVAKFLERSLQTAYLKHKL